MTDLSIDQAKEFATSAMKLMEQYDVPPTPSNFQIWYCYASGQDLDLKFAIDVLISNRRPFTPERNAEIAEQYFGVGRSSREVHEASKRLQELASTILDHVDEAKTGATTFGERVADISADAVKAKNSRTIAQLAHGLIAEVRSVTSLTSRLEENLSLTRNEVSTLRESLVKMRKEATTDPLTSLANRRAFSDYLEKAAIIAGETGEPLSVLILDIDHFKDFNDAHGHRIGDEVLKIVGNRLKQILKGQDLPARYGGEEFIAVLPNTDIKGACAVADQIRLSLCSQEVRHRITNESYGRITASFGVAAWQVGEALEDFIHRADEALYRAKRDGRNRVEIAVDPVLEQSA